MENYRDEVIVIFAGYPKPMESFLARNPGMRSRIAFRVNFEDYTAEELCEITTLMAGKKGLTVTDAAMEKLRKNYETARSQEGYGNGRYVRKMLEEAEMNLAERIAESLAGSAEDAAPDAASLAGSAESDHEAELTAEMLTTIDACDIPQVQPVNNTSAKTRRIGFAV